MRRSHSQAGVTLIEVTIAVTLLALLSTGMLMALRVGLSAYSKTESKLMENRRVAGAQRILQQELEGLVPAYVECGGDQGGGGTRAVFFQGTPNSMWLVSTFSLQQGWRGVPQILQIFAGGGELGGGRLLVNETAYTGAKGAGQYCSGTHTVSGSISRLPNLIPTGSGTGSFVLADNLAYCRFSYYGPGKTYQAPPEWSSTWDSKGWPMAIRVEMAPAKGDPSRLQPISVTAPIHIRRDPDKVFTDEKQ